jgi:hypothetical protein
MSIQRYPCADCHNCIPIGGGEGLCDWPRKLKDKKIVDLFDVDSECPKPAPPAKGE